MRARASCSLSSVEGINDCPPKPGFTDINNTRSILSITYFIGARSEAGLNTRPAWQPASRINWRDRSTCVDASG